MMIRKLLIANRGEIACRIIRTCRRLGVATVAVYSDADATAQHVKRADEAWRLGESRPSESYLRGDKIIEIARQSGADAIHPGFGFLSENVDFAEAVEAAGIRFVGPRAASMRKLGSKAGAKILMSEAGVPVVPGYTGEEQDADHLYQEAVRVGFPLMIKAAHGGGGKGMRVVHASGEFIAALESCQREARNAFGKDRVLLERYIETPRHIEFQIFGDQHGQLIHLNERECSVQRRYQKIFEETPCPMMDAALRTAMGNAAVRAGQALDYVNAGTVEFIVGAQGDFYFMEINTRLQVEHPVTEATLGIDLVEWQLRIAAGESLPWRQQDVRAHGHAIEVRLYAEDPSNQFLPSSGPLQTLRLPTAGAHVRIDSGVIEGDTVTVFYDPMIAKLITHDRDRVSAMARMREALAQTEVGGIRSNIEFLETLLAHPKLIAGQFDTGYLDRCLHEVLPEVRLLPVDALLAGTLCGLLDAERASGERAASTLDPHSPWAISDAWRPGHLGWRHQDFDYAGQNLETRAQGHAGSYRIGLGSEQRQVRGARCEGEYLHWIEAERAYCARVRRDASGYLVHWNGQRFQLKHVDHFAPRVAAGGSGDVVSAPMPGRIVAVRVMVDQQVQEQQEVLVMEAMKMELSLKAPRAGRVESVRAEVGQFVEADTVLMRLHKD